MISKKEKLWPQPLASRLKLLEQLSRKKKVIYLYEAEDYGTFRYRVYNPCQILNHTSDYEATYFFESELKNLDQLIKRADLLILVRFPWSFALEKLLIQAKQRQIPLVFDVDDLVFDVAYVPQIINHLTESEDGQEYEWFYTYVGRRYVTALRCDFTSTTTAPLCAKLMQSFPNKKCYTLKNFLNNEQVSVSREIYAEKISLQKKEKKSAFVLGYFSGTRTHHNDFRAIAKDLITLMQSNDQVNLRLAGYLDLPNEFKQFDARRVKRFPLMDFIQLQRSISECDLNLIPLTANDFNDCKSELKYFESAVVGTPSLASPSKVYQQVIRNGYNGFISLDWKAAIEQLIHSKEMYMNIQENAYAHALSTYHGEQIETSLLNCIEDMLSNRKK